MVWSQKVLKISREFFMGRLWEGFWEGYGRVTGYTGYHRPVVFLGQLQYNPWLEDDIHAPFKAIFVRPAAP